MTTPVLTSGGVLVLAGGAPVIAASSGLTYPLEWGSVGHSGELSDYGGSYTITAADTTLENYRFTTRIDQEATADNLTIRNCFFDCSGVNYCLDNQYTESPTTSLLIEDCSFVGATSAALILGGSGTKTIRRCQFRDCRSDLMKLFSSGDFVFEDCYFGGLSRTEYGEIDFDNQTSNFTVGARLTGGTSGSSADIVSVTDNGTTGTIIFNNASNGISATVYFSDNETLTDDEGGSATAAGAGTYEDIHADGFQNNITGDVDLTRCTFDMPPASGGLQIPVTSGSWLESDGIESGGIEGEIYYRASIGYFGWTSSGSTATFTDCHFVKLGSNGVQIFSGNTAVFSGCRFYPTGIYNYKSGSGTFTDGGDNLWAETANDLQGNPRTAGTSVSI